MVQKPQTMQSWFESMPGPNAKTALKYHLKAIKNESDLQMKENLATARVPSVFYALKFGFPWSKTKEGFDFWEKIAVDLKKEQAMTIPEWVKQAPEDLLPLIEAEIEHAREDIKKEHGPEAVLLYNSFKPDCFCNFIRKSWPWSKSIKGKEFWTKVFLEYHGEVNLED